MKDKKELLYKRALITCIIMLFVSIILKLFGSTLFNFDTNIPLLQYMDNIIMNNEPMSFIYSYVLLFINGYLIILLTIKDRSKIKIIPLCLVICISILLRNLPFMFIADTLMLLFLCLLFDKRYHTIVEFIIVCIINILYQILSLYIRSLGFKTGDYGYIISVLFLIDYYIMLVITYLYLKKGDTTLCLINLRFGSYLANRLWKKRTIKSKQCSSKCEHDG